MDPSNAFSTLNRKVHIQGLLRKQPQYYNWVIARNLAMLAITIGGAVTVHAYSSNFSFQIPFAIALGFVFGQFAFLSHDTGHEQIAHTFIPISVLSYFSNIFQYGSLKGWHIKHNVHHTTPNNTELDPDCDIPAFAFTNKQAEQKRSFWRWLTKYQAYFFLPVMCFTGISIRATGIKYLLQNRENENLFRELMLCVFSLTTYMLLWSFVLGFWHALAFMLICELIFGLYMGMTFVTNHYGMSFDVPDEVGFLIRQVTATRNIGSTSKCFDTLIHFLYGGLNRQIEHHLWSYMPRCNLKRAEEIVREQCVRLGIVHHRSTPFRAYCEIYNNFADIGRHLREYDCQKAQRT